MVSAAGKVTVKADSSETFFAVAGRHRRLDERHGLRRLDHRASSSTRSAAPAPSRRSAPATTLAANGDVEVTAIDKVGDANNVGIRLIAGNLQFGSSAGIGIASAILVRSGTVDAAVEGRRHHLARRERAQRLGDAERERVPARGRRLGRRRRRRRGLGRRRRPDEHRRRRTSTRNARQLRDRGSCANGGSPSSLRASPSRRRTRRRSCPSPARSASAARPVSASASTSRSSRRTPRPGSATPARRTATGNVTVDATSSEDATLDLRRRRLRRHRGGHRQRRRLGLST